MNLLLAFFMTCSVALYCPSTFAATISAILGDITKQKVDCIVNAANPQLQRGDGVCGAIFKAAGAAQLQRACNEYPSVDGVRCPVGEARSTSSFNLSRNGVQYIIHAVGPDGRIITDHAQQIRLLMDTYTAALTLAEKQKVKSIAFPFISSGIYAINPHIAAEAAVHAAQNYSANGTAIEEITFVLFTQTDLAIFTALLQGNNAQKTSSFSAR